MKIKKIIIVDDDLDYINEIEDLLIEKKFEIIKKNNTDDILNFVKKNTPDLIILDMKINGLTGIDVAKILNKDVITKKLPIMLLTNYYNEDDSEFNKNKNKFGINICLKKTIKPEELIKEIIKIEENQLKVEAGILID
jgi:CheY-like chemotaxis protein